MTKTARKAVLSAAVVAAILGSTSRADAQESSAAVASPQSLMAPDERVRGVSARMGAVIREAEARSKTFRWLVDQIGATDGIAYVEEGQCGHGVRTCLLHTITIAGTNRVLWIVIDPRKSDLDLMGSVGHELQHAVEVLSHRSVRDYGAMILLYKGMCGGCGPRFETDAAIEAGIEVRAELKKSSGSILLAAR